MRSLLFRCPALAALLALLPLAPPLTAGYPSWRHAVQLSVVTTTSPAAISLSWVDDPAVGANGYRPTYSLARRRPGEAWPEPTSLGRDLQYTDRNVQPGIVYEYRVLRDFRDPTEPPAGFTASGYVWAGINVPAPAQRGKVILVIEQSAAAALAARIDQLKADLAADRWTVAQLIVNREASPAHVRDAIRREHQAGPGHSLYLLGAVPVAKSGRYAPDYHEKRPMPTDAYYGDVDGVWPDADNDGVFDLDALPSDVDLAVGRVDFRGLAETTPGLSEHDLLARYLDKVHAFRTGATRFEAAGVISDRVGVDYGRVPAAGAFRGFAALYGPENITVADAEDNADSAQRWLSHLQKRRYGWAFVAGGGSFDFLSYAGHEGQYHGVSSATMAKDSTAAFYLMFGSYLVEWDRSRSILRAALASPNGGFGAAWSGRPNFIIHPMALGATIGECVRLTQNNDGVSYLSPINAFQRGVHINWMGDPTLRLSYQELPVTTPSTPATGIRLDLPLRITPRAEHPGPRPRR